MCDCAALALCDWSDLQKARRSLARQYCHPRMSSMQFETLSNVLTSESGHMVHELNRAAGRRPVDLKPILLSMCANVFTHYMCSSRFAYDDQVLRQTISFIPIRSSAIPSLISWLLSIVDRFLDRSGSDSLIRSVISDAPIRWIRLRIKMDLRILQFNQPSAHHACSSFGDLDLIDSIQSSMIWVPLGSIRFDDDIGSFRIQSIPPLMNDFGTFTLQFSIFTIQYL